MCNIYICNICGKILNSVNKNDPTGELFEGPVRCESCYSMTNYFPIKEKQKTKTITIESNNNKNIKLYKRKLSYAEELTKKWQKKQHRTR